MKVIKWILIFIAGVFLLGIVAATFFINPAVKKLKPSIVAEISSLAGTEVSLEDISARLLPTTQVELTGLAVGGPNGLKLSRLFVDARLSELLKGKLAVRAVTVDSPVAELRKNRDGSLQLGELKLGGDSPAPPAPNTTGSSAGGEGRKKEESTIQLDVQEVKVQNGVLRYSEEAPSGVGPIEVTDVFFIVNDFVPSQTTPFRFSASLLGKGNISGDGSFVLASFKQKSPTFAFHANVSQLDLPLLQKTLGSTLQQAGKIELGGTIMAQASIKGDQGVIRSSLDIDATPASLVYASKTSATEVRKIAGLTLRANVNSDFRAPHEISVKSFDLKLAESILSGSATLDLQLKNKLRALSVSFEKLLLGNVKEFVALPLELEGQIAGPLALSFSDKPFPDMQGVIELSQIGISRPGLTVSDLHGQLAFDGNKITSPGLKFTTMEEAMEVRGRLLELQPNRFESPEVNFVGLGGTAQLQSTVRKGELTAFAGTLSAAGIDLKRASTAFLGEGPFGISGTLTGLSSSFKGSAENLKNDLSASFDVHMKDGELLGANLIGAVFEKLGIIPGLSESLTSLVSEKYRPLVTTLNKTAFAYFDLNGTVSNSNGSNSYIVNIESAELTHEAYRILGNGKANTAGFLDLRTQLKLTPSLTSAMVARQPNLKYLLDKEGSLTLPVMISRDKGPILFSPDPKELGRNALQGAAKDAATKALDKVAPGIGRDAAKLLDKLF